MIKQIINGLKELNKEYYIVDVKIFLKKPTKVKNFIEMKKYGWQWDSNLCCWNYKNQSLKVDN